MDVLHLLIGLLVLLFSTALHESAHALTAAWFGDRAGVQDDRATLNPWRHVDVFWTLLMPVILFVVSSGAMVFGMARPVRFGAESMRGSGVGLFFTIVTALTANFMLALFAFVFMVLLHTFSPGLIQPDSLNAYFVLQVIFINLLLVALNTFVPIPPLDLARLVRHSMNARGRAAMDAIEPFGIFAVMLILCLLFVGQMIDPIYDAVKVVMGIIIDPDYAETLVHNLRGTL